jgi:hypothetical protein
MVLTLFLSVWRTLLLVMYDASDLFKLSCFAQVQRPRVNRSNAKFWIVCGSCLLLNYNFFIQLFDIRKGRRVLGLDSWFENRNHGLYIWAETPEIAGKTAAVTSGYNLSSGTCGPLGKFKANHGCKIFTLSPGRVTFYP